METLSIILGLSECVCVYDIRLHDILYYFTPYVRGGLGDTAKESLTHYRSQNGRHFADDIFKCIFFNENVWIPIKISLKFVLKSPINNIPTLV